MFESSQSNHVSIEPPFTRAQAPPAKKEKCLLGEEWCQSIIRTGGERSEEMLILIMAYLTLLNEMARLHPTTLPFFRRYIKGKGFHEL